MFLYKDIRNFVYDIPSLSHVYINIDSIQEPPKHAYQNRVLTTTGKKRFIQGTSY